MKHWSLFGLDLIILNVICRLSVSGPGMSTGMGMGPGSSRYLNDDGEEERDGDHLLRRAQLLNYETFLIIIFIF